VHDKQVRRRRAVLALLVAVSLICLTAYFGAPANSPLHTVQRGIVQVLSPIQVGASRALKPVRDLAGWFSGTFHAKAQRDELRKEVQSLQAKVALYQRAYIQNQQLTRLVGLDNSLGISAYRPVAAEVIERDPTLWYQTVEVDKGSDDGVHVNDPVIGAGGLVGRVSMAGPAFAIVTLITDNSMAVAAQIQDSAGDSGVLVPDVGNPNQLLVQYLPRTAAVRVGQQVVSAGFKYGALQDLYPAGIPIGTVSGASQSQVLASGEVQVTPAVDLRHLDAVQVLTAPHGGADRAAAGAGRRGAAGQGAG
jgi:rod shape-determining protein MreC